MSRRDHILALATSKIVATSSVLPSVIPSHRANDATATPLQIKSTNIGNNINAIPQPIEPTGTDINKLWSRPYDFNDFPVIFDHKNEYRNFYSTIQTSNLEKLQSDTQVKTNLNCSETMISSSDEEELPTIPKHDIFETSDDSVKDKNYEPDSTDCESDASDKGNQITTKVDVHMLAQTEYLSTRNTQRFARAQSKIQLVNVENVGRTQRDDPVLSGTQPLTNNQSEIQFVNSNTVTQDVETENTVVVSQSGKGLTKAGLPRKRRKFEESLSERLQQKKEREIEKLSLKPPCESDKCRKKCSQRFTEEMRKKIHERYLNMNWEARGLFIKGFVKSNDVKIRTTGKPNEQLKRQITYTYYFNANNERIEVCKTFFLSTLGYNPKNDRRLHLALKNAVDEQQDKRGHYERQNVIDKNVIKEHIQSFHPTISHYRREHAPFRLYLPSDVNITLMHQKYTEQYPDKPASLETYRKVLKQMNISFTNLGNEECEQCAMHTQHIIENYKCREDSESCETCIQNQNHKKRYETSREEYRNDVAIMTDALTNKECIYYSVDLQKVIMLPRMDQYKIAIFCPRIVAFNESFVPLGPSKKEHLPYAVLWNESISGRNQEDIISAFKSFLIHKRDLKHIVLWADNCSAQNKNWALFCFLVNIINSRLIEADSITIKYFEPGHTFMSADHFHHQVEKALKRKKKVYDFDDFVDTVKMANAKKNEVKVMTFADFYNYEDVSSHHKLRNQDPRVYLKDIMSVKAKRGDYKLQYKIRHDFEWQELNFLQAKILKSNLFPITTQKDKPRGITSARKAEIISKLVPLMPETRRAYWECLPVSDRVSDL